MSVFKKDFTTITKTLTKVSADLEALAERESAAACKKKEQIDKLTTECNCHDNEVSRARKVAKNVNALLEVK